MADVELLHNGGGGWRGTFALTVLFAVKDVLSDGEPFDAEVGYTDDRGRPATVAGQISSIIDDGKIVVDGRTIAVTEIHRLAF